MNIELAAFQKTLIVAGIALATIILARLGTRAINLYTKKFQGVLPSTTIFANITRIVIYALGFLVTLQSLGISITPILTALGVGGLAVALALQDTLNNLFSGLQILASRQIRLGDFIKLETGEEGCVVDVSWRNTTIETLPGNLVIVANSKLASTIITNFSRPAKDLAVVIKLILSSDNDLEKVESLALETAKEVVKRVPGAAASFEPLLRYRGFGEYGIEVSVIVRARDFMEQNALRHELVKKLHQGFKDAGVEITFPTRALLLKDKKN